MSRFDATVGFGQFAGDARIAFARLEFEVRGHEPPFVWCRSIDRALDFLNAHIGRITSAMAGASLASVAGSLASFWATGARRLSGAVSAPPHCLTVNLT